MIRTSVRTLVSMFNQGRVSPDTFCTLLTGISQSGGLSKYECGELLTEWGQASKSDAPHSRMSDWELKYTNSDSIGGDLFYMRHRSDIGRRALADQLGNELVNQVGDAIGTLRYVEHLVGTDALSDHIGESFSHVIELLQAVTNAVSPKF